MAWDQIARATIVELYFKTDSLVKAQRAFRRERNCRFAPCKNTIRRLVKNFRGKGSVVKKRYSTHQSAKKTEAIEQVQQSVSANRRKSSRKIARETRVPRTTVRRILHQDLGLFPYKIQMVHKLHRGDKSKRLNFCRWFLSKCQSSNNFSHSLFMSDEAHFHLDGTVNKQNCRMWSTENPHEWVETEQYPIHITVWCAISAKSIIGPYFFEEDNETVTVTAPRYGRMINHFFIRRLHQQKISMNRVWFQQDGAKAHTAKSTITLLKQKFGTRVVSKNASVEWPPRSPDLTAPDFFLWGHLKNEVYREPASSVAQLKSRIRRSIKNISIATLEAVMNGMQKRCEECIHRRGGHLDNVIF